MTYGLDDKRILITGATGYVGEHVTKRLLELDADIVLFARDVTKINKIFKDVRSTRGDILDKSSIKDAMKDTDIVLHLATSNLNTSISNPMLDFNINAAGTFNLLDVLRKSDVEKIVFTSTSKVYGDPLFLPINENHPCFPHTPYGASKLAGESYCHSFYHTYGLKYSILRFFNIYGSKILPDKSTGVISIFVNQLLKGLPIKIEGSDQKAYDFVHIEDAVNAIMLAMTNNNCNGECINIGSGEPIKLTAIAKCLIELNTDGEIIFENSCHESFQSIYPDPKKAKEILKYKPKFNIIEGLKDYIIFRNSNKDNSYENIDGL